MEYVRQGQGRSTGERRRSEKKERYKKRKQRVFLLWQFIIFIVLILLLLDIKTQLHKITSALEQKGIIEETKKVPPVEKDSVQTEIMNYVELCGMENVEKPVKRDSYAVLEELKKLAKKDEIIKEIYQENESYPMEMMEALANNPEMARFVRGYKEGGETADDSLTELEKKQEHPLLLQWDPRWGYSSYGDNSNIGLAGCGPTSLSMVLYYLTGDESLTPKKIAAYSMEKGYYVSGTGTAWALMQDVPGLYGIKVRQPGIDETKMKNELDQNHIMICAMREGDFTVAGHFIVIYGYDENGFKINDPNCVARSRKSWPFEKLKRQIKSLWSFSG